MDDIFAQLVGITDDAQSVTFALQMAELPNGETDFATLQNFINIAKSKENDGE